MLFYLQLLSLPVALLAFAVAFYTDRRVEKRYKATDELDWEAVAALTGDMGVVKKAVQRVNNRINGLERGHSAEEQALAMLMQQQPQNNNPPPNGGYTGG